MREEFLDKVHHLIVSEKLDFLRHIKSKSNNYDTLSTDRSEEDKDVVPDLEAVKDDDLIKSEYFFKTSA